MVKVGAVQMVARTADISYNLSHVRELAEAVIQDGAKIIALPEFFTTSIVWDRRLWGCSLPPENRALEMLKELAIGHGVMIGGSYLEMRDGDVYNTYALVQPDGTVFKHNKDIPTMIEGAFYVGGNDDGVNKTTMGRVGNAVCWETIRSRTVRRLKNRIDFLMTGSHWWAPPTRWYLLNGFFDAMAQSNREYMAAAPAELARILGVPNLHAAHAGPLDGRILLLPTDKVTGIFPSHLMGETQIIDNKGAVLGRMKRKDGAGFITAELDLSPAEPTLETPERFWIPRLEKRFHLFWHHQNICARAMYRRAKRSGLLHTWE